MLTVLRPLAALLLLLTLSSAATASALTPAPTPTHFVSASRTGNNAVMLIPRVVDADLGGRRLEAGDEIAVLTSRGVVAGAAVWTGSADIAIPIWEDDVFTGKIDGFKSGESLHLRVWDRSADREWQDVRATYERGALWQKDGRYKTNAMYLVASLRADADDDDDRGDEDTGGDTGDDDTGDDDTGGDDTGGDTGDDEDDDDGGNVGGAALGELGRVTLEQTSASAWTRVRFQRRYRNPVVVVSPVSYNGPHPTVVRVRRVTATGFEVQLDEWDYLDGAHATETLSFLVVEAGTHEVPGLGRVEAGTATVGAKARRVRFARSFGGTPVVLSQVVEAGDERAVVTRQESVSRTSFEVYLQTEGAASAARNGTVAWVAITPGASSSGVRFEAGRAKQDVRHDWERIRFGGDYGSAPFFLAAMQSAKGPDAATLRYQSLESRSVEVMVEEEQSRDPETTHAAETVGYLVFAGSGDALLLGGAARSGLTAGGLVASAMEGGTAAAGLATSSDLPTVTRLEGNYPNPFSGATTVRYTLAEEAPVRLEVFDLLGRRVAVLADGVQPAGVHEVAYTPNGLASGVYLLRLQAGARSETARMTVRR